MMDRMESFGKGQSEFFVTFAVVSFFSTELLTTLILELLRPTWYEPRLLSSPHPLSHLSPSYDAQLLLLRSLPNSSSPHRNLIVLFPFSTTNVSTSLRGDFNQDGSKLWLRTTRDSSLSDAKGHLAVAWGPEGTLRNLIEQCTTIATETLLAPSSSSSSTSAPPPSTLTETQFQGLGACTWNALGPTYTLSSVISWLTRLKNPLQSSPLVSSAIDTVLLDDGWQDVITFLDPVDGVDDRRGLRSWGVKEGWFDVEIKGEKGEGMKRSDSGFETSSPVRFDEGVFGMRRSDDDEGSLEELREGVKRIKELGIQKVGVWMTLEG